MMLSLIFKQYRIKRNVAKRFLLNMQRSTATVQRNVEEGDDVVDTAGEKSALLGEGEYGKGFVMMILYK